jgi:hypothetical protein
MAQSAIDKIPPGPRLDALTAEKVFGWQIIPRSWENVGKKTNQLLSRKLKKMMTDKD